MNILVPLNNIKNIQPYACAGADEFYMGFNDLTWYDSFGENSDINRMSGFRKDANSFDYNQLIDAIKMVKKHGKKAFVTFNANTYSKRQIDYIVSAYFPGLKEALVDGVIISTVGLATAAIKEGLNAVGSTMLGVYNRDIAKYMFDLGINRIILPRDLSLDEIASIVFSVPYADFEVFFMRNGCVFSDGYCLGTHVHGYGSICGFSRFLSTQFVTDDGSFENIHDIRANSYLYNQGFHHDTCGMCALYRFYKMGISSLKIVGRADNPDGVLHDIELTHNNIEILKECRTEQEYLEKMLFPSNSETQCLMGLSCYYPEVRFS